MKKKYYLIIAIIALVGTILISGCIQEKPLIKENNTLSKKFICDITNNPNQYINKTIEIEANLKFIGENYWTSEENFFLEENNCKIQVFSWAPTEVINCPPTIKDCHQPSTMATYLDKRIKLNGILKKLPKEEYINEKWTVVGNYYIITEVRNVSIIA